MSIGDAHRYRDPVSGLHYARVLPGGLYASEGDEIITTVLGSCIAMCIADTRRGLIGMNHFMLPTSPSNAAADDLRFGDQAMIALLKIFTDRGADPAELSLKLFGGARILSQYSTIGLLNVRFARAFARDHRLKVCAEDLEGGCTRSIQLLPGSGLVRLKRMDDVTIGELDMRHLVDRNQPVSTLQGSCNRR